MNGQTATRTFTQPANVAPAYSLLRDVNGHPGKSDLSIGRYTAVSKSVTKTNGTTKGIYPPAIGRSTVISPSSTTGATIEANRRSQSQQNLGRTSGVVYNSIQTDNTKSLLNGGSNSVTYTPVSSIYNQTNCITVPTQRGAFKLAEPQHTKSHSVTSTVFLRESNSNTVNRSAGGSLSCGQPSPSSTTEESVLSALSPTSSNNTVRITPGRPQHQSYWLHQSEILLPTDRDLVGSANLLNGGDYTPRSEIRVASVSNLDAAAKSQTIGTFHTLDQNGSRCFSGSSMIFAGHQSRNDSEDYLGNFASGEFPIFMLRTN
ncbi:hypothetical protein FGIG_08074 [Fasciola gigantica]|uniref:Uncharacterized protein n=1 Tax=Fasciola gigantica TaxID=46835 RepID=A0A504YUM9_FASGI|nr:hypothetical protein FGIG_08074 [Fasciola gigantica]